MQQLERRNINTYTPTDIPHIRGTCGQALNREETLSVSGLKTSSNISDAALTAILICRTELASTRHSYQSAIESGTRPPIRYSATNYSVRWGTLIHTLNSVVSATPAPHGVYEIEQDMWKPKYGDKYYLIKRKIVEHIGTRPGLEFWASKPGIKVVWLPRQDDIQAMFDQSVSILSLLTEFYQFVNGDAHLTFSTFEQLWLAFYMKQKHKMEWDGKDWITSKEQGKV